MGSEALHVAKIYRHLLKSVKNNIGYKGYKLHFTNFVRDEFKKSRGLSDPSSVDNKLKLARDYAYLLNNVHHQKELLFSYNIAVDRTEEMKKTLSKSASSVGLQLPEVYQP